MFDIDDDKFGFCTGFELDGPVREAGCDDKVWPMVAPGAAINEVFDEKDLEQRE